MDIDVDVQRHGRVTETTVTWNTVSVIGPIGHGSALRSKCDVELAEIGEIIALGRAIQDLGKKIEASGHALCVTKDEYERVMRLADAREDERAVKAAVTRHGKNDVRKALMDQIAANLILDKDPEDIGALDIALGERYRRGMPAAPAVTENS